MTTPRRRNPILLILFAHATAFLLLLLAFMANLRSLNATGDAPSSQLLIGIPVLAIIVLVSLSVAFSLSGTRARKRVVRENNPNATVVSASWSAGAYPVFFTRGPLTKRANWRGFGVEIMADRDGVRLWRGGHRPIDLGLISWERVRSIAVQPVQAQLGSRILHPLVIEIDEGISEYLPLI